jgi:hypothetical protein
MDTAATVTCAATCAATCAVTDLDLDSDTDAVADAVADIDWTQVEEDLHIVSKLQAEAYERLTVLTSRISYESYESYDAVLSMIQSCHEKSMEELENTGEVTFGQRLLQEYKMNI